MRQMKNGSGNPILEKKQKTEKKLRTKMKITAFNAHSEDAFKNPTWKVPSMTTFLKTGKDSFSAIVFCQLAQTLFLSGWSLIYCSLA